MNLLLKYVEQWVISICIKQKCVLDLQNNNMHSNTIMCVGGKWDTSDLGFVENDDLMTELITSKVIDRTSQVII